MISQTTHALCEEMKERDIAGFAKYGETMDRDDLKPSEWCQHAIEEQMDNLKYLKRLKDKLEEMGL
ncbi:MAG: hypothetical protein ACPHUL_00155 [Marinomonas gallaica]